MEESEGSKVRAVALGQMGRRLGGHAHLSQPRSLGGLGAEGQWAYSDTLFKVAKKYISQGRANSTF